MIQIPHSCCLPATSSFCWSQRTPSHWDEARQFWSTPAIPPQWAWCLRSGNVQQRCCLCSPKTSGGIDSGNWMYRRWRGSSRTILKQKNPWNITKSAILDCLILVHQRHFDNHLQPVSLTPKQRALFWWRKFVTGLWGCGAFRGDPELKFLIQWHLGRQNITAAKLESTFHDEMWKSYHDLTRFQSFWQNVEALRFEKTACKV